MTQGQSKPQTLIGLIGNTPLVELKRLDTGKCRLFVKLENQNPGGSIKDRIALSMIEAAERDGKLKPGGVLVEATAGNTGLGLALVAAQKGYRLILVIPDKMSREKIFHLKALGAEVVMTRSDVGKGHPEYYQDMAERIARETPHAFYINQFANPANPLAHEKTTGPEIWEQMNHQVDAVVCGVGSGGTLAGLSRYFHAVAPQAEMVLADPKGSMLYDYVTTGKFTTAGSWLVEGIGEDFIPSIADLSRVKKAYRIPDEESFSVARALLKQEGILCGSSSGTLVAAALRYCQEQTTPKNVVTLICDSGNKYLSKMFNDYWMADHGFARKSAFGDLRDLVTRPFETRETIIVEPGDKLSVAYSRMKLYDISQLPVVDKGQNGKVVGIIDESDVLMRVYGRSQGFSEPVSSAMTANLETLPASAHLDQVVAAFEGGKVALIEKDGRFYGLVTRMDLLNYLRLRQEDQPSKSV